MEDDDSAFEAASALLDAGQFGEARKVLADLISQGSHLGRARAYALTGWSRYREGEFGQALADFTKSLASKPDAENTLFLRARCHEEMNDPSAAMSDYEAVLRSNPNTPDAWDGASLIHRYFGRGTQADECARRAAEARGSA